MSKEEAIRTLLEEIKKAAGKCPKDVFFFIKADQALALLKPEQTSGELVRHLRCLVKTSGRLTYATLVEAADCIEKLEEAEKGAKDGNKLPT